MVMSLMLLKQLPFSNSHWSVFNLQELPGSEELTGTDKKDYLSHFLIYYLIFLGNVLYIRTKKREKNNILKILKLLTLTQKVRITRVLIPACDYT